MHTGAAVIESPESQTSELISRARAGDLESFDQIMILHQQRRMFFSGCSNIGNGWIQLESYRPGSSRISYEGNFGEQPVGQTMRIHSWGLYLQATQSGKIVICHVEPTSVAARSGIKRGAILKSLNRTLVHDLLHLNGLLLQTGGKNVQDDLSVIFAQYFANLFQERILGNGFL